MTETKTGAETSERAVWLIRKRGFYFQPNERGYTTSAIQAGRYTLEEADRITHPNGPDGPRDGMTCVHVDDVRDADFAAYLALTAERDRLRHELEASEALNAKHMAEIERLREHFQNVMGHVDTPISRRRLKINNEQPEWLTASRAALKEMSHD